MKRYTITFFDGKNTRLVEWYAKSKEQARLTFERSPNWCGEVKKIEYIGEVV